MFQIQNAKALKNDIENAARVNRGVELARSQSAGLTVEDQIILGRFIGQASRSIRQGGPDAKDNRSLLERYKQITIHRYHPDHDLGGLLGSLGFERSSIETLMQMGYDDALHHDCREEECIGPDGLTVRIREIPATARQS